MPPGAHHLRRLRLHVRAMDPATGQALRSQFEAGLSRRLAAVVAAVCEEMGPEEELLRLDRLDLQLGAFALEELDREAPLALERALRDALLQALAAARHNPAPGQRLLAPREARLERLLSFLRLGVLPWRVASEPFAPADDLLALLRADPAALLAALRRLAGERSVLERLVLQLDPERFALLLGALAPADAALILTYLAEVLVLHRQQPLLAVDADPLRHSLWLVTLTLLLRDPGTSFNRRTFLDRLLRGVAAEHRLSYSRLLRQLEEALRMHNRSQPLGGSLPALVGEILGLRRALAPALAVAQRDPEALLALLRADPSNSDLHSALEPRLSAPLFASLIQAIAPEEAPLVLATVDDVALVHRQAPLLPLAPDPFERLVRRVALQLLLAPSGSPFERLSFLRQLLRHLAQSQRLVYTDLLRTFAAALRRLPRPFPPQSSLPELLDTLIAAEMGQDLSPGADPAEPGGSGDAGSVADGPRPRPRPPFAEELWDAFLRAGHPAHLGPRLQEAVERDPARFAALLR
ncbi:MAG: contractile injection system tape measure protein, partial [Synechococcaceae cyanobacterium]|nr:contractile injection system tape measure protein [Synechococcaceae cyanobacterium]